MLTQFKWIMSLFISITKIIYFTVKHKDVVLYVCNQPVNLVEHETYLGNYIVSDIFDRSISHTVHPF